MNNTKDDILSEMKNAADRLCKLLDDPHPGLVSWCVMLAGCISDINRFYDGDRSKWPK